MSTTSDPANEPPHVRFIADSVCFRKFTEQNRHSVADASEIELELAVSFDADVLLTFAASTDASVRVQISKQLLFAWLILMSES